MRLLHTRLRVADLERSIAFYALLGMAVRGRSPSPRGNELVFLAAPEGGSEIELCRIPNAPAFSFPEDLVHIAFQSPDLRADLSRLAAAGVKVTEPYTPTAHGALAFIEDPDGYEVELLETHPQ